MKKLALCALMYGLLGSVNAQLLFRYVSVIDADSKQALNIAIISTFCQGKLIQYDSSINGYYKIAMPANATCYSSIEAQGYETQYNLQLLQDTTTVLLDRKNNLLQDIVVTGHAKKTLAQKSIYKVQVLNSTALQQLGATTLADAMSMQNSFFAQQDNILGASMNMQGIGGQNIKILINGVPLNGRENGNIDLAQINLAHVERIEIIKGPMSVLYGTDALGGVINIITKQNATRKTEAMLYTESVGRLNAQVLFSYAKKRNAISASVSRNFFGGAIVADTFERSTVWKPKEQYLADVQYSYATSRGKLTFLPSYMHEKIVNRGIPSVDPFGAFALDEYYTTLRSTNTIIADWELDSNRKINLSNNVSYYQRQKNSFAKDLMTGNEQAATNGNAQDTSIFLDYNSRGVYHTNSKKSASFLVGYELALQRAYSKRLVIGKQVLADVACFVSWPIELRKKIIVQPAVRVATNTFYKAPITPSLNIKWDAPKQLVVRASYARGFRAPSLKELYLQFVDVNHNVTGNAALLPERSHQLQLHIDAPLWQKSNSQLRISNSIYYNSIANQIALALVNAGTNAFQYANVASFQNVCNETQVQYNIYKTKINASASFNTMPAADSGRGYTNIDAVLAARVPLPWQGITFNSNYRYISKQAILSLGVAGADAAYNTFLPQQHLLDCNVQKTFAKQHLQVQLGVKNVIGTKQLTLLGNSNGGVHGSSGMQNVSVGRSAFAMLKWAME